MLSRNATSPRRRETAVTSTKDPWAWPLRPRWLRAATRTIHAAPAAGPSPTRTAEDMLPRRPLLLAATCLAGRAAGDEVNHAFTDNDDDHGAHHEPRSCQERCYPEEGQQHDEDCCALRGKMSCAEVGGVKYELTRSDSVCAEGEERGGWKAYSRRADLSTRAERIFRRRVAATPRLRRGHFVETSRGDAVAVTWRLRGDESRRRRGRDVDIQSRQAHVSDTTTPARRATTSPSTRPATTGPATTTTTAPRRTWASSSPSSCPSASAS